MWLTSFLSKQKSDTSATKGSVAGSDNLSVQVDASTQLRNVSIVAPYGISYIPPVGEEAVVVPYGAGEACVGVVTSCPDNLERGELMLCSVGGASIVLKNDGTVLINGVKAGG